MAQETSGPRQDFEVPPAEVASERPTVEVKEETDPTQIDATKVEEFDQAVRTLQQSPEAYGEAQGN